MKFKYKKIIIMITMGTMLIGSVVFTTVGSNKDKAATLKTAASVTQEVEETASPSPSPTPKVTSIQKDLDSEVTEVVKNYLMASVACDMDALEDAVNDISMLSEDELKVKYKYVENVRNIECYMIPDEEGSGYLVYAYRELKLKDIDTLAPGLSRVYVKAGDNGQYRVYFGADTGLEDFINRTDQSQEVKDLVSKVNQKMEEAINSDKDLKAFVDKITASAKKNTKEESSNSKK